MADYVSNYSGDQIDEAVGRALPGGALDTGKAPAGFGLGVFDQSKPITKEELDLPKGNGWYFINAPYSEWSDIFSDVGVTIWGVVRIEGINANFCRETIFDWYYQHTITRTKIGGDDWEPWEWVNPPMQLGVEYRTTERYLGKPVYAKLVDCGKAGAGTASAKATTYKYGIATDATDIVGWNAVLRRTNTYNNYEERRQCPVCDADKGAAICYTDCTLAPAGTGTYDGLYAVIHSHADLSAWTVYLYVKYTKG